MGNVLVIASLAACAFCAPIAAAQNAPAASKQSFDQLLQAAGKARDESRDDEAIRLYRRAVAQQPESEQGLWFLGTLLYEKEQYPEARADSLWSGIRSAPAGPTLGRHPDEAS